MATPLQVSGPLPEWLVTGLAIGGIAAVVVAGLFVAGERFFPAPPVERGRRIDGNARRRREIREVLRALDERVLEDHDVRGSRVAFYLPERDVAITFDAQAFFRLDAAGTHAVLWEDEMPGGQVADHLPFETPGFGSAGGRTGTARSAFGGRGRPGGVGDRNDGARGEQPGPPPEVRGAFDHLGLAPDAAPDAVKSVYRDRVKEVHPDTGGDEERFKRLRNAYDTALDYAESGGRDEPGRDATGSRADAGQRAGSPYS